MNFLPILIISLILLVITVLLAIAEKLLINYGKCKITIHHGDDLKEFEIQGGGYLLQGLTDNGIKVNSSCGGKATCGYCKVRVLSGGGQLLPTEEAFMSREEKLNNMRLACQVKIKNDIDVFIPDFLTTVKGIVKNKMFDPKLRWRWLRTDLKKPVPEMLTNRINLAEEDEAKVRATIEKYTGTEGAVVPVLQELNNTFHYLSEPVLRYTSGKLNMPLGTILRIATFYNAFSLKPRGKNIITVCLGTACHVKGSGDILSTLERELGLATGETTKDMLFTLDAVRCIGCCGLAPVVKVNEDIHGLMTKKKVPELISSYKGA
jgi:NADH:ubiquinone oxidoreductase subunit E/ferredoxin